MSCFCNIMSSCEVHYQNFLMNVVLISCGLDLIKVFKSLNVKWINTLLPYLVSYDEVLVYCDMFRLGIRDVELYGFNSSRYGVMSMRKWVPLKGNLNGSRRTLSMPSSQNYYIRIIIWSLLPLSLICSFVMLKVWRRILSKWWSTSTIMPTNLIFQVNTE